MLLRPTMLAFALVAALFEFHSPFWLDLHHRLYAESGRLQIEHQMPPEAKQRWQAALAAYRELYPERTLASLFRSDAAQATRRALDGDDLSLVDPKLRTILEAVAPVYREHIWPSDQKADARFIEALQPLLAKHGATVAKKIRLAGELGTALEEAGKPGHDDLWHALLFFTAGEVVKQQIGPDYVPYAKAQRLWERVPKWSTYLPLLEKHWIAVVDGKATPSEGMKALVTAL